MPVCVEHKGIKERLEKVSEKVDSYDVPIAMASNNTELILNRIDKHRIEDKQKFEQVFDKLESQDTKIEAQNYVLYNTPGVVHIANDSKKYMEEARRSKNGFLDWTFRCFIGILVSFICIKIGFK